jgi:hypothetical protein
MGNQWFAGQWMQHFRQIGVHPFALSGGEYDNLGAHRKIIA